MIFDFAGEDKFDQFAADCLSPASKSWRAAARRISAQERRKSRHDSRRSSRREFPVERQLAIRRERAQLRERVGFDGESGKIISGLGELLGLNEVFYPLDLPRAQILQCAFFLEPFNAGESILLVLQDALVIGARCASGIQGAFATSAKICVGSGAAEARSSSHEVAAAGSPPAR